MHEYLVALLSPDGGQHGRLRDIIVLKISKDPEGQRVSRPPSHVTLRDMTSLDQTSCVALIGAAMNSEEAGFAQATLAYHFGCRGHGLDDGRQLYVTERDGQIAGIVGIHHYVWGPPDTVWLSWFAVDPPHQRQGIGTAMLQTVSETAAWQGFRRLLVETYSGPTFTAARRFYRRRGFKKVGSIRGYLNRSTDMVVFSRELQPAGEHAARTTGSVTRDPGPDHRTSSRGPAGKAGAAAAPRHATPRRSVVET